MIDRLPIKLTALMFFLFCADTAFAYVGPGAGLSLLGALWGLIMAVGAVLAFVILWPFRRLLHRIRGRQNAAVATTSEAAAETEGDQPDSRG